MLYSQLKPYRATKTIIIPPNPTNKNICFGFFGENASFLDVYRRLGFKTSSVKNVFVPYMSGIVRNRLTPQYRKILKGHKLLSFTGPFGDYSALDNKNFFIDYTGPINQAINRYQIKNFKTPAANIRILPVLATLGGVSADRYERVLLYAVSVGDELSPIIMKRKFYIIYQLLLNWFKDNSIQLPFDKIIIYMYHPSEAGQFMLLFDKDSKLNSLSRIKSILVKLGMSDQEEEEDVLIKDVSGEISTNNTLLDQENKDSSKKEKMDKVKKLVYQFVKNNPNSAGFSGPTVSNDLISGTAESNTKNAKNKKSSILLASVLSHTIGDPYKSVVLSKKMDKMGDEEKKKLLDKNILYALPKYDSQTACRNPITLMSNTIKITDNTNPKHVLEKRKNDFKETLLDDIVDAFKVLKTKPLPLKINSVRVSTIKSSPSELKPTLKDRYSMTLTDYEGNLHDVFVDLPHLTENGTFVVNGQQKIIINQLVVYPIFFFKPYSGKFTSSYSTVSVYSKILKKSSYLMLFMCGVKCPLIIYLAYREGFSNTLKKYGVTYTISDTKTDNSMNLPNGKYIEFHYTDLLGEQLVASFSYSLSHLVKENFDIESQDYWKTVLEKFSGNRNVPYLMDQIWQNVVTPIEVRLLESRGDPTNISDIVHYISGQVVQGRVDDRNTLDRQRIRTSEIFVALLQKQILAAYNEYESKRESGDKNARLYINSTKIFSEVINSQNVQALENINPLEELSVMTRVTPIGVGGIPDSNALPVKALNIHDTYFGNIDPLETPDGPNVGIQQQLSIGSNITNVRGTFMHRDRSKIKPTEILSTGPCMIPFVESNEGARVTMATGQAKQAVPLKEPDVPCIQTGYEGIFTPLLSDSFIKKSPIDGVVHEVTDNLITISELGTNKKESVDISSITLRSGQGQDGLGLFKPIVNVGNKVKKDEIIAEGSNIRDGLISNGLNMLVAFMPWKGYNFEDGMVISESAAARFVSLHVDEQDVVLKEGEDVVFVADIGSQLDKGGLLLTYTPVTQDVESYKHLRSHGGKVVDLEIFSNLPEEEIPEKLLPHYKRFRKRYTTLRGSYPIGHFKEKDEKIKGILVRYKLQQELSLVKGDKLNNRHFNKGVVSIIEKDENMPRTPWGDRIDMVYNPLGVLNRMITGQILELHCGLISRKLGDVMINKSRKEFTSLLVSVLPLLDGTEGKTYSNSLIKNITSVSDNVYAALVNKVKKDGFFPLIFVPFKSPDRKNIEKALALCSLKSRYSLYLPEFDKNTDPVAVGYVYVLKLEHMSEKKIHARGVGPYVEQTLAPTGGKRREGGQALGEYDMYSLLGWDCPVLIDEFFGASSSDHNIKNQLISEIIQTGNCAFKQSKSNPVKDLFAHIMLAVHLVSE